MNSDGRRRSPADPARRQVLRLGLTGLAVLGLGGCGVDWGSVRLDVQGSPTPPTLTPDMLARFAAVDRLTVLRLQAEQLRTPEADRVATAHQQQVDALGELPGPVPSGSVTPSDWPTPPPTSAEPAAAADLATDEQSTAVELLTARDLSADGARLLTSVATSCLAAARLLHPDLDAPMDLPVAPDRLGTLDADDAPPLLQAVADAEDAAGFAYATYAAALTGRERDRAVALLAAHRDRAMQVRSLAASGAIELVPPPAAYAVSTPDDVIDACAQAERSCAVAAAGLFTLDASGVRPLAQSLLVAAGQAQAAWVPLPALPGLT